MRISKQLADPAGRVQRWLVPIVLLAVLTGCSSRTPLVATPYIMWGEQGQRQFQETAANVRTPHAPIVFFTDRAEQNKGDRPAFGDRRSGAISFGTAHVRPEPAVSWEKLVQASTSPKRSQCISLELEQVEVASRISPIESLLTIEDGRLAYTQQAWDTFLAELDRFDAELDRWLKVDPDGEVILFVHGFHNDFESAAVRLAAIWHAGGRVGVPLLFSWPAGYDGFMPIAYNHDRESGEFSIRHLKILLFALARNPNVKRVHLIAHSRGTDVVVTALREIKNDMWGAYGGSAFMRLAVGAEPNEYLEPPGQPKGPAETLKLATLVLAAADIDQDVFIQRFIVEQVTRLADRTVIYSLPTDRALRVADLFFGSRNRLGQATYEDFEPSFRELMGKLPRIEFVHADVKAKHSHAYAFEHPAALSDLIRLIRDDAPAGSRLRPLTSIAPNFWRMEDGYLRPDPQ